jgi:hypothetical protein
MPVIGLTESFRCWAIRRFGQTKRRFSENGFDFRRMMQTDPSCMTPLQDITRHCCFIPNLWRKPYGCVVAF